MLVFLQVSVAFRLYKVDTSNLSKRFRIKEPKNEMRSSPKHHLGAFSSFVIFPSRVAHRQRFSGPLGTPPCVHVHLPSHPVLSHCLGGAPITQRPCAYQGKCEAGVCVCKGLAGFGINIATGLATFPRSANNLRGGESGRSISSACLLRSWPPLVL